MIGNLSWVALFLIVFLLLLDVFRKGVSNGLFAFLPCFPFLFASFLLVSLENSNFGHFFFTPLLFVCCYLQQPFCTVNTVIFPSNKTCFAFFQLHFILYISEIFFLGVFRFIRPEDVPVQYGGLSRPSDLQNGPPKPASEFTVKGGEKVNIQIEGIEVHSLCSNISFLTNLPNYPISETHPFILKI